MKKLIVWALFDSGNGCYTQAAKDDENIEIYPIGLDIENKNKTCIQLNLADFSQIFGDFTLFNELDKLPKPDLILASPPCESWSVASSIRYGNQCWKRETKDGSRFVVRTKRELNNYEINKRKYTYNKSFLNRINGELCIFNTIEIIQRYKPKVYVIENPAQSRIWHYIQDVMDFPLMFDNLSYYGNYGFPYKKPTRFYSNIALNLKCENYISNVRMYDITRGYNARSAIPLELIKDIYKAVKQHVTTSEVLKVVESGENHENLSI